MTIELLLSYGADLDLIIGIGGNTIIPKLTERAGDLQMENDMRSKDLVARKINEAVLGKDEAHQAFSK